MTVYIKVPTSCEDACREMLAAIGYWGQASSLTCCVGIEYAEPEIGECALPLSSLNTTCPVQRFFPCFVSEFRNAQVHWDEVMPSLHSRRMAAICIEVYVWPMVICERRSGGKMLLRRSLE
jgi:hypothetical protein